MQHRSRLSWMVCLGTVATITGFAFQAYAETCTVVPEGSIATQTWCDDETTMILDGRVIVPDNVKLTILPGCVIRGQGREYPFANDPANDNGAPGILAVRRGGFLDAQGTATSPIIFTTATVDRDNNGIPDTNGLGGYAQANAGDCDGTPNFGQTSNTFYDDTPKTNPLAPLNFQNGTENLQLWGGVVMAGYAPTNLHYLGPPQLFPHEYNIEGTDVFPGGLLVGGGAHPHDSSGIITYVSIRHGGDVIGEANEINGISGGGIGDGTRIENLEVYANWDDCMEWWGGTVNVENLLCAYVGDDNIDLDDGYTGTVQNALILSPFFNEEGGDGVYGSGSGDRGGEWDGDDCFEAGENRDCIITSLTDASGNGTLGFMGLGLQTVVPLHSSVVCNMTFLGNQPDTGPENPAASPAGANRCVTMRNGFMGDLANSLCLNTGTTALDITGGGLIPPCTGPTAGDGVAGTTVGTVDGWEGIHCFTNTLADTPAPNACALECFANGDHYSDGNGAGGCPNSLNPPANGCWDQYEAAPDANRTTTNELLVEENTFFPPRGVAVGPRGKLQGARAAIGLGGIDPRPSNGADPEVSGGINPGLVGCPDVTATYRGAVPAGQTPLFTTGWTAMSTGGILAN